MPAVAQPPADVTPPATSAGSARAALSYAERLGWPVFPLHGIVDSDRGPRCTCAQAARCPRAGKHPRTAGGFYDATRHPDVLRAWFTQWPQANLGVPTGAVLGAIVLDVDPRHGGDDALAAWEAEHGALPDTVEQLTGSGGRHLLFQHPGGTIPNAVNLAPGLDVRGDGGYIAVAPSRHLSGRAYVWEAAHRPRETPLAPCPGWLVARMQRGAQRRLRADGAPLVLTAGERNDTLFRIACANRRYGLSAAALRDVLAVVNRAHCTPALPDDELARIADSAARYQARGTGT